MGLNRGFKPGGDGGEKPPFDPRRVGDEKEKGTPSYLGGLPRAQINRLHPMLPRCNEHMATGQGRDVEEGDHVRRRQNDVRGWECSFRVKQVGEMLTVNLLLGCLRGSRRRGENGGRVHGRKRRGNHAKGTVRVQVGIAGGHFGER